MKMNMKNNIIYFKGIPAAKSGIHIKPENRGKFTETKKRTGKTTEELTHSKNPLTRKRAIFAQNAKKWKHFLGGSFQGIATDNGIMISKDKNVTKSKPKMKLIKKANN